MLYEVITLVRDEAAGAPCTGQYETELSDLWQAQSNDPGREVAVPEAPCQRPSDDRLAYRHDCHDDRYLARVLQDVVRIKQHADRHEKQQPEHA